MQKGFLPIALIITAMCCFVHTDSAEARGMPAVNLNLIPTAETLGKGGYSLSVGMLPYDLSKEMDDMDIDIGGFFKERHHVELKSDIWLIPSRITYGISERFDFTFGGTYSAGDTDKTISDYYETGGVSRRVYSQVVLDGLMGVKYRVQQGSGRIPDLAIGGEVQMGYTVDDALADDTLENSFPFVAMQMYMSASYDIEIISVHGGLGMFVSSKSIQSNESFDVPIQAGVEIPFNGFAAIVDIVLFRAFSGVGLENIVSAGFRYDISPRTTLNASAASAGGFLIRLTVSGRKPISAAPPSAPTLF